MTSDLRTLHAILVSPFVDDATYRSILGGSRSDLSTIARYGNVPPPRRPSLTPYFDPAWYRVTTPNLAPGDDALVHFLQHGLASWRNPHPLIDLRHMAGQDPDLFGTTPAAQALVQALEGDMVDPSPYFDRAHYTAGLNGTVTGLLRHYLLVGIREGRSLNPYLDLAWYEAHHDDVQGGPYWALCDFILRGDPSGRAAGPEFDGTLYWRRYPDVAEVGAPPLRHFLSHGRHEGRQAPRDRSRAAGRWRPTLRPEDSLATGTEAGRRGGERLTYEPHAEHAARRKLEATLREVVQYRKDRVVPRPPPLVTCDDPAAMLASIILPEARRPVVSILIPAFNEPAHTIACLTAIMEAPPAASFEVVVADDASTDRTIRALSTVQNLVVVRQGENVGFIRNCNAAYARCRGAFVLLLNNDAQMLPHAVDAMLAAFEADPKLGAVGPKILYPDGRLQEAGCGLTTDGQSQMIGLFLDPEDPDFSYDRDVAYCSGAALMLRRAAVGNKLFDESYAPAYCEDADLCLRLWQAGWRVRYVSDAQVVHFLSASADPARRARRLRGIARNQARLASRWSERLEQMDRVRPIAFYLPQFYPTPQNDLWWGRGFTEWTNVARAQPSFEGHYQPHLPADLGFYDLRLPDSLRAQAALAARYGIEGFCVYHYDFGTQKLLDAPMRVLRANPDIPFRHCLCWANENWTRHWDGGAREILAEQRYDDATLDRVMADVVRHARDPRYLTVEGQPLFLVYRPLQLPDPRAFATRCRRLFQQGGFAGVHLVYVESMEAVDRGVSPAALGFDAAVEFPPHGRAVPSETSVDIVKPGWSGYRYDYARTIEAFVDRPGVPYRRYPAVFPGWDNTPRQPLRGTSFDGASPDLFGAFVAAKIEEMRRTLLGDTRLLFVNAWNEWAEGAHLEPDAGYGHRWLEALADAVEARRWN